MTSPRVYAPTEFFPHVCRSDYVVRQHNGRVGSQAMFYHGSCPGVLDARAMSEEAEVVWSTKCGVRWPSQDSHVTDCITDYRSDVCPVGWRGSGKDCVVPGNYVGCHSVQ